MKPGSTKDGWQTQQQAQILQCSAVASDTAVGLRPVFPGSMLFNQILIPSDNVTRSYDEIFCAPESLSVVYEYCSHIHQQSALSSSILIDAGELASVESVAGIIDIIEADKAIEQIVLLGAATKNDLVDLIAGRLNGELKILTIEPDWNSAYTLHRLYRQARHVVFVDTMRVLDAAYSQCNCSLLAGTDFQADQAFELLVRHLERTKCDVRDLFGVPIDPRSSHTSSSHSSISHSSISNASSNIVGPRFLIAQNQLSDLLLKLDEAGRQVEPEPQADWLQQLVNQSDSKVSGRVINHAAHTNRSIDGFLDYKTRVARKAVKLRHDPRAFLIDSNSRVLKRLARIMPQKRA